MGYEIYLIIAFVIFVYLLVQILHMHKPAQKEHPAPNSGITEAMSISEQKVNNKVQEYVSEDTISR